MIAAVDTNVLLDVLIPGQASADQSRALLDKQLSTGKLIISSTVVAELASCFITHTELASFLDDCRLELIHDNLESLSTAGTRWARYSRSSGRQEASCPSCGSPVGRKLHVLADFLIGAHALAFADCILSRDLGIYRTWFRDLKVLHPTP